MAVTGQELATHCTKESCWIVIHGRAYDVTEFLSAHPGGASIILKSAGQDATEEYDSIHNPELVKETLPPSAFLGPVDPKSIPIPSKEVDSFRSTQEQSEYPPFTAMINVDDFEVVAKKYLTPSGWAYYSSGADDEYSKQEAAVAFRELKLRPRILRNVDAIDTSTTILGKPSSLPIYVSPTGLGKYAYPQAECTLAIGAGKEGLIQVIPTSPSMSIEAITGTKINEGQPQFFQLYVNRDHEKARALIRRVEKLGISALFITVDSAVLGKRERDDRLKSKIVNAGSEAIDAGVAKTSSSGLLNSSLSWDDLDMIREVTKLPLVLKGIQTVEDAVLAYKAGVQGIVLSNHGGRSQDTAQIPIITLLEIRRYAPFLIGSKMEIFIDGGFRRGTDIIKAIALGATAVGIGRPCLYSMTAGYGELGFRKLIQILRSELEINMALIGATSLAHLVPEMVNSKRLERDVFDRPKL